MESNERGIAFRYESQEELEKQKQEITYFPYAEELTHNDRNKKKDRTPPSNVTLPKKKRKRKWKQN